MHELCPCRIVSLWTISLPSIHLRYIPSNQHAPRRLRRNDGQRNLLTLIFSLAPACMEVAVDRMVLCGDIDRNRIPASHHKSTMWPQSVTHRQPVQYQATDHAM